MRLPLVLILVTGLAGCAGGGPAADQARNDHDLGVLDNAGLALQSQVGTDARNVEDILRRARDAASP